MANDTYYDFYDLPSDEVTPNRDAAAQFATILGGAKTISMTPYTSVFESGNSLTRFLPGQITYAPITLYRLLDNKAAPLMAWFDEVAAGQLIKKNCSIVQLRKLGRTGGVHALVIWDLIGTLPIAQPGFSYNSYRGTVSAKYKLTLQAEEIIMTYIRPPLPKQ